MKAFAISRVFSILILASFLACTQEIYAQEGQPDASRSQKYNAEESYNTAETYSVDEVKVHRAKKTQQMPDKAASNHKESHKKEEESKTSGYSGGSADSESVLSFNFLHYMIQKFKFADVVDQ